MSHMQMNTHFQNNGQEVQMQEAARIVNNFEEPFSEQRMQALDYLISFMYSNDRSMMAQANKILSDFKVHEMAWLTVPFILNNAQNVNSKFLSLQILDDAVQTRWQILNDVDKTEIRNCLVEQVINFPESTPQEAQQTRFLLTKLNGALISIVKFEWQTSWQNFIPEICTEARKSESKCENALNILKMMSEEIFDFSKNNTLKSEIMQLKSSMVEQFQNVYELCYWVLSQAVSGTISATNQAQLVKSCLRTLQTYLSWIPLNYIFQTDLIENLIKFFIQPPQSRNEAIKCFTEIANLDFLELDENEANQCRERLCLYYCNFIEQISQTIKGRLLTDEFRTLKGTKSQSGFENFARQVALAVSSVLKQNNTMIEKVTNVMETNQMIEVLRESVRQGLDFMIQLTNVPEEELFKICIEFWHWFCQDGMQKGQPHMQGMLQQNSKIAGMDFADFVPSNPMMQNQMTIASTSYLHTKVYPEIYRKLRTAMIDHMTKPKEVLLTVDEYGEVEEEHCEDTEQEALYEQMRETIIYLTNIDIKGMESTLQTRLESIQDKNYFTFDRLNKLCWALGSITGCMPQDQENQFVVMTIKQLLALCENSQGKNSKAQVATDIMYVVGQFPQFLIEHWAFLRTVIKKLNEFMHEKHPGVQDMASETFLKLAKLTKQMFVVTNQDDKVPYINVLIKKLPDETQDLKPYQKLNVYEGLGWMISAAMPDKQIVCQWITELLLHCSQAVKQILDQANSNMQQLMVQENIKTIDFMIKANQRVVCSAGPYYVYHLQSIFEDLIKVYRFYSQMITQSVLQQGTVPDYILRPMRSVRRDILRLIQAYINEENDFTMFNQLFLPTLKDLVDDYQQAAPKARDPEVLLLFSTMMKRMGEHLAPALSQILISLNETTLLQINQDLLSDPEFRDGLFRLIEKIVKHCTQGLFSLAGNQFQTVIMTILFAMEHVKPEQMELGLEAMNAMLIILQSEPQLATQFYQTYYTQILSRTFNVLSDYQHMSGFKLQNRIIMQLVQAVDREDLINPQVSLHDMNGQPHQMSSNKLFVQTFLSQQLINQFPNLNQVQVEAFVLKLFNTCQEQSEFKDTMRDLLISMKQFAAASDEFYRLEKGEQEQQQKEIEQQKRASIPGMITPGQQMAQQKQN